MVRDEKRGILTTDITKVNMLAPAVTDVQLNQWRCLSETLLETDVKYRCLVLLSPGNKVKDLYISAAIDLPSTPTPGDLQCSAVLVNKMCLVLVLL